MDTCAVRENSLPLNGVQATTQTKRDDNSNCALYYVPHDAVPPESCIQATSTKRGTGARKAWTPNDDDEN